MLQRKIDQSRSETNYYPSQSTISIHDDSQQITVDWNCQEKVVDIFLGTWKSSYGIFK
jgi:hypothetical protein